MTVCDQQGGPSQMHGLSDGEHHHCTWVGTPESVSSGWGLAAHTRLSNILMKASNCCSPTCQRGWSPSTSASSSPDSELCRLALYFSGSSVTKLSGPPAPVKVRTWNQKRGHNATTRKLGASEACYRSWYKFLPSNSTGKDFLICHMRIRLH